jgi:hypothetical protein
VFKLKTTGELIVEANSFSLLNVYVPLPKPAKAKEVLVPPETGTPFLYH